jgi:hypothetical protein
MFWKITFWQTPFKNWNLNKVRVNTNTETVKNLLHESQKVDSVSNAWTITAGTSYTTVNIVSVCVRNLHNAQARACGSAATRLDSQASQWDEL